MQSISTLRKTFRALLAFVLMALAANCFLKYLWWTACYNTWAGIPKMVEQWRAAGANASFNGWSLIVLEIASIAVLFSILHRQAPDTSGLVRKAPRLILSLMITLTGTAVLALVLSWVKQVI